MVSLRFPSKDQGLALQILLSIPATLWIIILYIATGDLILRLIKVKNQSVIETLLLKTGLGFGMVGNLIMILNILNLASKTGILILLTVLSILCIPQWLLSMKKIGSLLEYRKFFKAAYLPILFLLFLLSLYTLRSFLPVSGFDALMYHLSTIQLYLSHHGFFDIFFNPQSDFPMLTEMNYTIGLVLGNDLICRQIDVMLGIITLGAIVLHCRLCNLSIKETITGCTIFLSMTVVIASLSSCDVDLALSAWISLSLYFFRKSVLEKSAGLLFIAAMFGGMAMETKIFGCFVLPLLIASALLLKEYSCKKLILVCMIASLLAAPWYIKSYLYQGTILSIGKELISEQGLGNPLGFQIHNPIVSFLVNTFLRVLLAPWSFSIMPSQHQQEMLGPLFLIVIPFTFIVKLNSETKYLLRMAGIYLALVLIMEMVFIPGGSSIRYLLTVPVFLIPVSLHIIQKLKNDNRLGIYSFLMILVIVQISLGTILLIKRYHKDWIALLTNKDRHCYYESILPQYPAIKFINDLKESGTIMTIYNYDNYLIKVPYISAPRYYANQQELVEDIQKYSISYIFANDIFDTVSNRNAFPQLPNKNVVFSKNGFYVYKVSD